MFLSSLHRDRVRHSALGDGQLFLTPTSLEEGTPVQSAVIGFVAFGKQLP